MDRRCKRVFRVLVGFGLGATLALNGVWGLSGRSASAPRFEQAVEQLRRQTIGIGFHQGVGLPARYRRLTQDGTVDLVRTADGRLIVLFKTSIGWKGNYSGVIVSDAPLKPGEIGADAYGRAAVTVPGLDAVITRKIDDRRYEVYFDLG